MQVEVRTIGLADVLGAHEPSLVEPRERHVDLAGVERLRQRAERELQARAELVAVRRVLGEQRQQDLLDDPQLIAVRRFLVYCANRSRHRKSPPL